MKKQKMVVSADIVEKKREMFYNADIINTLETYSSKNETGMEEVSGTIILADLACNLSCD